MRSLRKNGNAQAAKCSLRPRELDGLLAEGRTFADSLTATDR